MAFGKSLLQAHNGTDNVWRSLLIGLVVSFGGVLFGYDTGIIGGILAMREFKDHFSTGHRDGHGDLNITPSQSSAVVSILSAGTFFGALGSPLLADRIGRRLGLVGSCCIFMLGIILQSAAAAIPMMLAGRFFAGVGVGLVSAIIPMYQSETAPKRIRGAIVAAYQLAITIGLLIAAIANNATKNRKDSYSYRIPIILQFIWAVLLIAGMLVLPETPRFLIKQGKPDAAARALSRLRGLPAGHESIVAELTEIQANHRDELERTAGHGSYLDCFRGHMLKRTLTGIVLQALQQMSGVNFIFYYGTTFFANSGVSNPFIVSMITSTTNVVSTIPGMIAIDRLGRRPLLFWGAIGQGVGQLGVGLLGTLSTKQDADGNIIVLNYKAQKALVAFVCINIFFFASSWGSSTWVVTGEIYPLETRAKALSLTTASLWLVNWALAYSTPYLVDYGKGYANLQSKIFFVWFGATIIMAFFTYFFIYETKNLTLEEVDELYETVKSARHSSKWVPTHQHLATTVTSESMKGMEVVEEQQEVRG